MKIKTFSRKMYGKQVYYPLCNMSKLLCKLLNQKVLTEDNIKILKDENWEILKD